MATKTAANPVQFKTIERKMELPAGTVVRWAEMDGFPVAAEGVAVESRVREFAERVGLWTEETGLVPEAEESVVPPPVQPQEVENPAAGDARAPEACAANDEIVWIEIRVPVSVASGKAPRIAHVPMTGFRFGSGDHDRAAREAMGRMLEGCRNSHVQRADGTHVDKLGHTLKWLLDQIAAKIPAF